MKDGGRKILKIYKLGIDDILSEHPLQEESSHMEQLPSVTEEGSYWLKRQPSKLDMQPHLWNKQPQLIKSSLTY